MAFLISPNPNALQIRTDHNVNTLALVIQSMNSRKADALQKTVDEIGRYVTWQKSRIKDWAPAPLTPITK